MKTISLLFSLQPVVPTYRINVAFVNKCNCDHALAVYVTDV